MDAGKLLELDKLCKTMGGGAAPVLVATLVPVYLASCHIPSLDTPFQSCGGCLQESLTSSISKLCWLSP